MSATTGRSLSVRCSSRSPSKPTCWPHWTARPDSSASKGIEREAPNAPGDRGDRQASDNGGPILMPDVEQHAREHKRRDEGRADAASHIDDPAEARAHA